MFISAESTAFGMSCQPNAEGFRRYLQRMPAAPKSNTLLENVDALMKKRWGKVNKTRLSEKAKVGQGTHDRIIEGTSIGLEVIEKISAALEVQPWQMLVPGLDPDALPKLLTDADHWPLKGIDPTRWWSLAPEQRDMVLKVVRTMIDGFDGLNGGEGNEQLPSGTYG